MDWFLNHILDIIIVLILVIGIIYGHSRGIVRMIISLVGLTVASIAASFISSVTYEYAYMQLVQPAVMTIIESKADELVDEYNPQDRMKELLDEQGLAQEVEEIFSITDSNENYSLLTGEQFRGTLNSVFTEYCTKLTESLSGVLPEEIVTSAEEYLDNSTADSEKKLEIFSESKESISELIEQEIIRPILLKTVKSVIFIAAFILINIIFTVISRLFGFLRSISAVKSLDSFFGGILGLIYGLLSIAAFAIICNIFIKLTGDENSILNTDVINMSYVFKYAYTATFSLISALLK